MEKLYITVSNDLGEWTKRILKVGDDTTNRIIPAIRSVDIDDSTRLSVSLQSEDISKVFKMHSIFNDTYNHMSCWTVSSNFEYFSFGSWDEAEAWLEFCIIKEITEHEKAN